MRKQIPIFFLLLLLVSSHVWGQQPQLEKVTIASGGHIVHFMPLDLAVAKGFFADEGLDPEITQLKGGTATAQALLAGQVNFSLNSIDHAFKAAVQGKDNLRMVVLLNRLPGMVLVVDSRLRNQVNSIADLKGRALGVTSKGSATHMVLASLLSKSGVNPAEVNIVDAGSATFPPALENRQIAGGIALEPFASVLVEQGKAFVLADLNTLKDTERFLGGPYNQAGVMTRQDVIDHQPGLVQKVVNAHIRALKWIQEHTPQEIAEALPREVVGTDKERYVKTLEKLREFYSPDGLINSQGVENVYRSMVASEAIAAHNPLELARFYTNAFVSDKNVGVVSTVPATALNPSTESSGTGGLDSVNWSQLSLGFILAFIPGGIYFICSNRAAEKRHQKEISRMEAQHIRQTEEIRESGLYPLSTTRNGLEDFENEICESIKSAQKSIQLCLATPLLHSLKETWIKYDAQQIRAHCTDHWAKKFCQPLSDQLRIQHDAGQNIRVEFTYLEDRVLEHFVSEVPDHAIPWEEYKASIAHFFTVLKTDGRALCDLFTTQVPDIPIYLALIDGPDANGTCMNTAKGIVGFMSASEVLAQRKAGRAATEIAKNLRAYTFTNPEVVRFFSHLFNNISLHGDQKLLEFLQQCQRSGYAWALITDEVPYTGAKTPYATLIQPVGTSPHVSAPFTTGGGSAGGAST